MALGTDAQYFFFKDYYNQNKNKFGTKGILGMYDRDSTESFNLFKSNTSHSRRFNNELANMSTETQAYYTNLFRDSQKKGYESLKT